MQDNLIYDRTIQDIKNRTAKGYYNFNDLNRIELWCVYIAEILNRYSYHITVNTKTNWTRKDFLNVTHLARIKSNVMALKNNYITYTYTPNVSGTGNMTFDEANKIEKILKDLDEILINMQRYFVISGVASCNQQRFWQVRFRMVHEWDTLLQEKWTDFKASDIWGGLI